jgi:hypothetical protein
MSLNNVLTNVVVETVVEDGADILITAATQMKNFTQPGGCHDTR